MEHKVWWKSTAQVSCICTKSLLMDTKICSYCCAFSFIYLFFEDNILMLSKWDLQNIYGLWRHDALSARPANCLLFESIHIYSLFTRCLQKLLIRIYYKMSSILCFTCTQQNPYSNQSPTRHSDYTVTGQWWWSRRTTSSCQQWLLCHCPVTTQSLCLIGDW